MRCIGDTHDQFAWSSGCTFASSISALPTTLNACLPPFVGMSLSSSQLHQVCIGLEDQVELHVQQRPLIGVWLTLARSETLRSGRVSFP